MNDNKHVIFLNFILRDKKLKPYVSIVMYNT